MDDDHEEKKLPHQTLGHFGQKYAHDYYQNHGFSAFRRYHKSQYFPPLMIKLPPNFTWLKVKRRTSIGKLQAMWRNTKFVNIPIIIYRWVSRNNKHDQHFFVTPNVLVYRNTVSLFNPQHIQVPEG